MHAPSSNRLYPLPVRALTSELFNESRVEFTKRWSVAEVFWCLKARALHRNRLLFLTKSYRGQYRPLGNSVNYPATNKSQGIMSTAHSTATLCHISAGQDGLPHKNTSDCELKISTFYSFFTHYILSPSCCQWLSAPVAPT